MDAKALNDEIRHLCAQAIMAQDDEIEPILTELRKSIDQHAKMVRTRTIRVPGRPSASLSSAKAAN